MICERCGNDTLSVLDSRQMARSGDGFLIRRRRSCGNCGQRVTTYEITDKTARSLLAAEAELTLLRDALGGVGSFARRPKARAVTKMLENIQRRE